VLLIPNTLPDNYLALHGIEELSASAMHGNHLLTHDNFVGRHDPQPALLFNAPTVNLLNAALAISPDSVGGRGFEVVERSEGLYILENNDALPRAAVFYQYEVETDSAATLERLRSGDFPYRTRLLLDQPLVTPEPAAPDAEPIPITPVRVVEWSVDRFVVEGRAERDGILWVSENYYPSWRATDDTGEGLPIYRADYAFRAVPVKAGDHRITFEFHSATFTKSAWLSLVCFLILIAGVVGTAFSARRE
jgi:hypothetical protein